VSQLKYVQEIEQGYIRRIETILQPIMGANNVRAQVAADIDFSVIERTDEKYSPNQGPGQAAVRSLQSSESSQHGGTPPGGVPGALTNQPPVNPTAPITAPKPPAPPAPGTPGAAANAPANAAANANATGTAASTSASTGPGSSRKDVTTNYEVDRSIRHVQQGAGAIKRLSVAVVVNYKDAADGSGKTTTRALTPVEIDQIRNLSKEAMGFSQDRGDSLNVVNSAFAEDREATAAEVPFWRDRENIELAKTIGQYLLLAFLALFAWFSVLRPLLRKHLAPPPAPAVETPPQEAAASEPALNEEPRLTPEEALRQREALRHKADMEYAHQLAAQDPKLVAMLIQHWMNANDQ
jgi:flagellar M-ring protein FliF